MPPLDLRELAESTKLYQRLREENAEQGWHIASRLWQALSHTWPALSEEQRANIMKDAPPGVQLTLCLFQNTRK